MGRFAPQQVRPPLRKVGKSSCSLILSFPHRRGTEEVGLRSVAVPGEFAAPQAALAEPAPAGVG